MNNFRSRSGFTLVESFIALGLGTLFMTSVMSAWWFTTNVWRQESTRSELRYDIERAMERLKDDVRLTDGNEVVFYPYTAAEYTAISLPRAATDSSGFLTIGVSGITWDSTVIYHVYDTGTKVQLRRTVIPSFNTTLATRQTQLNSCVTTGSGPSGSTTEIIYSADDTSLTITPSSAQFDGYVASGTERTAASFGSIRLASGTHTIKFEVTGKNASSGGYQMGLDTLTLSPSGCEQESEELPFVATDATVTEDMSALGLWGGNYHIELQSGAVGDSITFTVNYDQWFESNFSNMTHLNTAVSGTNPSLSIQSREDQGLTPAFHSEVYSGASPVDESLTNQTVRVVIPGSAVTRAGQLVRLKFVSAASGAMQITKAYFGNRSAGADFDGGQTPLYFDNAPVDSGDTDPAGSTAYPGSSLGASLSAGQHVWTNWFEWPVSQPSGDFIVSVNVSTGNGSSWLPSSSLGTLSYRAADAPAALVDITSWAAVNPAPTQSDALFTVEQMATWIGTGTATSQVYDTRMTAPIYSTLDWDETLPVGSQVAFKVRAGSDEAMTTAPDWSAVASHTSPIAGLAAVDDLRYVQFQAEFTAASPYTTAPSVDNVKIDWPGQTALVEISGAYTKRSDYGKFKVTVDGQDTVKSLAFALEASEELKGETYDHSLYAEVEPRNTGR